MGEDELVGFRVELLDGMQLDENSVRHEVGKVDGEVEGNFVWSTGATDGVFGGNVDITEGSIDGKGVGFRIDGKNVDTTD